jgi:hypothetical protein
MSDRTKPDSSCALCESWSGSIGDPFGECRKTAPVAPYGWVVVRADEWCQEFSEDAAVAQAIAARAVA